MVEKAEEKKKPHWLKYGKEETEELILKLAKQGLSQEKIGLVLRDNYGIPAKSLVKSISSVLARHNMRQLSDLDALRKKAEMLRKHLATHHKDKVAARGLQLTLAKITKLEKYYERKGLLK